MSSSKIKAVIWDLDETIWEGFLAEDDQIKPKDEIVKLIKKINEVGIINSLCSKNNYELAKNKLKEFNIWDFFVFSVIDFLPKGQAVLKIIENLQLRPENVLFIDDNISNINEVKYYCQNISTGDVNDIDFLNEFKNMINNTQREFKIRVL